MEGYNPENGSIRTVTFNISLFLFCLISCFGPCMYKFDCAWLPESGWNAIIIKTH